MIAMRFSLKDKKIAINLHENIELQIVESDTFQLLCYSQVTPSNLLYLYRAHLVISIGLDILYI